MFDTPQMARDYAPRLGGGRQAFWPSSDDIMWYELNSTGINRAVILWDYDPYDAPHGRSESRLHEWKNHIMWQNAFANLGQWDEKTGENTAVGERIDRPDKVLVH